MLLALILWLATAPDAALAPAPLAPRVEEAAAAAAPARTEAGPLARVAFVGASVTAGFGTRYEVELEEGQKSSTSFDLASVFEAALGAEAGVIKSYGDAMFFGKPMKRGPAVLKKALADEPTMIVGLDFLFWYAYGAGDHEGQPVSSREQRFAKLEAGLALLEPVECLLVLGDLADMSAAVGTMLMPNMVPDAESLAIMNGRIYEWADERENVIVLPLAATVARIQADQEVRIAGHVWPAGSRTALVHKDKLHSTMQGMVALTQLIAERLDAASVVRTSAFELEPEVVLERLHERALVTARRKEEMLRAAKEASTKSD